MSALNQQPEALPKLPLQVVPENPVENVQENIQEPEKGSVIKDEGISIDTETGEVLDMPDIENSGIEPAAADAGFYRKFAQVLREIGRVEKTGFNQDQKYKYAEESQIVHVVRSAILKHGLVAHPITQRTEYGEFINKNNTKFQTVRIWVDYALVDIDHPESRLLFTAEGFAMDISDKALYKAQTGASKNFYQKFFSVPTGDDPEKDSPGIEQGNPAAGRRAGHPQSPASPPGEKKIPDIRDDNEWLKQIHEFRKKFNIPNDRIPMITNFLRVPSIKDVYPDDRLGALKNLYAWAQNGFSPNQTN